MKRRISILTLTLLFFAANTALPFTLHICRMLEMTESCGHMAPKEDSCCEEEMEADVYIAAYDQCCSATIVDPSLKENYLGSKNELSQRTEFLILDFKQEDSSLKLSFNKIRINISPPFSAFQNLYLINSILLI